MQDRGLPPVVVQCNVPTRFAKFNALVNFSFLDPGFVRHKF